MSARGLGGSLIGVSRSLTDPPRYTAETLAAEEEALMSWDCGASHSESSAHYVVEIWHTCPRKAELLRVVTLPSTKPLRAFRSEPERGCTVVGVERIAVFAAAAEEEEEEEATFRYHCLDL